jgi:hypothetical protein
MDSSTSLSLTNGLIGFGPKRRSRGSYGLTRSFSWMSCSLWTSTRSSLLMPVSLSIHSRNKLNDIDQIVRTDMQELVDLDLQDHVYAYPPMGHDRHEMEGFRFWKTGYWKEALRGRPYHISALYVIDLKRFRQLATGVSP